MAITEQESSESRPPDQPAAPAAPAGWRRIALVVALVAVVAVAVVAWSVARGDDHDDHDAAPGHDHGAPGPPEDDKGLSLIMNGQGEGGGHTHATATVALDPATQAELDAQLAKVRAFADRYPTVRDAEADGYTRMGPYAPGLGAHYMKAPAGARGGPSDVMDDESLAHPTLIFDGITPDARIAGFMYLKFSLDTERAPEGFAGPNDHWHYHTNVCVVRRPGGGIDTPLGADTTATKELCDRYGGVLVANTGYMVHVWPVPGYESPQGMFSNANAKLACPDGTYYALPPEEIGHRANACKSAPE